MDYHTHGTKDQKNGTVSGTRHQHEALLMQPLSRQRPWMDGTFQRLVHVRLRRVRMALGVDVYLIRISCSFPCILGVLQSWVVQNSSDN